LIDAGLPIDALNQALGSLAVGCALDVLRVMRAGVVSTKVDVRVGTGTATAPSHDPDHDSHHDHAHDHKRDHGGPTDRHGHSHPSGAAGHRSLKEIAHLIGHSSLSAGGKARAVGLFRRLAETEAAIHDMPVEAVHLHEVGALDSIIDIVGFVFGMEWFGVDEVVASPLNVGGGTVRIAHGTFPVPAPATLRLLEGAPVYSAGPQVELVTPTGALLVSAYAGTYGSMPTMTIARVGYGAGTRDFADVPNVVRVVLGERSEAKTPGVRDDQGHPVPAAESIVEIQCEIDDMNPQVFGVAADRLFEGGALDVFLTAVQMKKGRPGTLVTVLAPDARRTALCDILFRETTTIGVRFQRVWREILERRSIEVATSGGTIRMKVSGRDGRTLNAMPEFDDCERVSRATGRPIREIQAEAMRAWWERGDVGTR
jgi:pyridinium-3,5-bisthiocarboxylic acid mononucleotide nickel chelatase